MRNYHAITVHYGDEGPTRTLVEQLLSSPLSRIVVVDHAEDPLRVTWNPERLTLVRPQKNAGYAAGINLGLGILLGKRIARSDVILAMNNDVGIEADTIEKIKTWWEASAQPAVAGIKFGHVDLLTGRSHVRPPIHVSKRYLPYLHGTLLMASLDTFLALQGLPNHFFMYWEDVLFSLRAQQMGIPLRTIPDLAIAHNDSLTELSDDHLYYLVRSGATFLSQSSPRPWRYLWRAVNPARRLYHALRPATPHTPIIRQALRDAAHGHTGKRL